MDDREVRTHVARVASLLDQLEQLEDVQARETAVETIQHLLKLYGEGLSRIMASATQLAGEALLRAFADDELITHLLLLHGLHPLDVETRVRQALQAVQPMLASHGGNVELLGIQDGVAHLRLLGSCQGCPSSSTTLKLAVERAIEKAAPDLLGIEAEGTAGQGPQVQAANGTAITATGFIPVCDLDIVGASING